MSDAGAVGLDPAVRVATGRRAALAAFPIAALVVITSAGGIGWPSIYARETAGWAAQGVGQDWVNLVVLVPALLGAAVGVLRGGRAAILVLGGALVCTIYDFVIYAFAIHFNALFLVYCAALGGSIFALASLLGEVARDAPGRWTCGHVPARAAGGILAGSAAIFALLWLSDDVPALLAGAAPAALAEAGLPTNPVHVLDLSTILPAMIAAGVGLWRGRPAGLVLAPMLLAFGILMGLSIAGMMLVMRLRGAPVEPAVALAMTGLALVQAVALVALLRRPRRRGA